MYRESCSTVSLCHPRWHMTLSLLWSPLAWAVDLPGLWGNWYQQEPVPLSFIMGLLLFTEDIVLTFTFSSEVFTCPLVPKLLLSIHIPTAGSKPWPPQPQPPCLPSSRSFTTLTPRGSVQKGGSDQLLPAYNPSMTPQRQNSSMWPPGSVCSGFHFALYLPEP